MAGHLDSVSAFINTFLIGQGLWPALAVFFAQQAAICWQDRKAQSILPTIAGLDLRVTLMQLVIIFGAGGVMLSGSGLLGHVFARGAEDFALSEMVSTGRMGGQKFLPALKGKTPRWLHHVGSPLS